VLLGPGRGSTATIAHKPTGKHTSALKAPHLPAPKGADSFIHSTAQMTPLAKRARPGSSGLGMRLAGSRSSQAPYKQAGRHSRDRDRGGAGQSLARACEGLARAWRGLGEVILLVLVWRCVWQLVRSRRMHAPSR